MGQSVPDSNARVQAGSLNSNRLFFLDFIRVISILMIILYHFNIQLLEQSPAAKVIPGLVIFHQAIGDLGVTLFIMISGVALMTSSSSRFSAVEFYKKRILAIFPSYWLAYVVVGCVLFLLRGAWVGDSQHWKFLLTLTGFDGLTFYRGLNYYLIGEWFIGFIIVLYLLFPLLRRGVLERPVLTWVLVIALFLVLRHYYSQIFVLGENRNPLIRLPEFLFGLCFLRYVSRFHGIAFGVSVICLAVFAFWYPPIPMQVYGIVLGIAVFCSLSYAAERSSLPAGFINATETAAKYSFLAFLVHHQIIYVLLPRFNAATLTAVEVYVLFGIVTFLSFVAAKLLYGPVLKITEALRAMLYVKENSPAIDTSTRVLSILAAVLGLAVVASTIFGVFHYYSPVPWWDEWDGYIGFYRNINSGWLGGWWVNHMEHRIVTSRVLFWLDIYVFGGQHIFLYIAELALIAVMAIVVWRRYYQGSTNKAPNGWVIGLTLALLFSWVQEEILRWGFETTVLSAYMFALLSVAQFSKFDKPRGKPLFLSLVFAILAEFSMGNGLMTFPTLFALAVICRRPIREMVYIAATWAVMWGVYFIDYSVPPAVHPEMPVVMLAMAFAKFFFVFLGNPVGALTNNGVVLCFIIGAATFGLASWLVLRLYRSNSITAYRAFLIGGYGFVVLSALAAMVGRAYYGPEGALVSRYTTGSLLGWLMISLLAFDVARSRTTQFLAVAGSIALAAAIAPFQVHTAGDNSHLYKHKLAILAHKIGADRPKLDALLFPAAAHRHFSDLATYAEKNNVALYGKGWLKDAGELTYDPAKRNDALCLGAFDSVGADEVGPVLKGWATENPVRSTEMLIVIADESGRTIGYGVTGEARPDVTGAIRGNPKNAGWTGFTTQPAQNASAYAYISGQFCKLPRS